MTRCLLAQERSCTLIALDVVGDPSVIMHIAGIVSRFVLCSFVRYETSDIRRSYELWWSNLWRDMRCLRCRSDQSIQNQRLSPSFEGIQPHLEQTLLRNSTQLHVICLDSVEHCHLVKCNSYFNAGYLHAPERLSPRQTRPWVLESTWEIVLLDPPRTTCASLACETRFI